MLTVYSDQASGETMSFKYYDADADMICDITETVVFAPDTTIGSAFDPFVMHVAGCPPYVPSDPVPADTATGISIDHDLAWVGGDPDTGDSVTYYVYFGTAVDPPCHDTTDTYAATTSGLAYVLPTLQEGETYYWKIVAEDRQGRTSAGSIWRFTVAPGATEPATWSSIKALYR